jgi:hypothetical protein
MRSADDTGIDVLVKIHGKSGIARRHIEMSREMTEMVDRIRVAVSECVADLAPGLP